MTDPPLHGVDLLLEPVEGHLTRTFQKLDLRSRDDLAVALAAR